MQYIKISLLSILIFLFGISTITFINVGNYQKNLTNPENSLSSVELSNEIDEQAEIFPGALAPIDISVSYGYNGKVTVNASWVRNQEEFGTFWMDPGLVIKLFDGETDTGLFENAISVQFGYDTDELSYTQDGEYTPATTDADYSWIFEDGDKITFSATISGEENKIVDKYQKNPDYNKNYYGKYPDDPAAGDPGTGSFNEYLDENDPGFNDKLFINNTFSFKENHDYRFEIYIYSGLPDHPDTIQTIDFTTPAAWPPPPDIIPPDIIPTTPNTWLDPVNFVLYVIILAEVIASISFFTILWINLRKN